VIEVERSGIGGDPNYIAGICRLGVGKEAEGEER